MTNSKQLEQLTQKRQQIDERIQQLRQRENAEKRRADTRRKVIIGGVILRLVKTGVLKPEQLTGMLNQNVTDPRDREFLGLE